MTFPCSCTKKRDLQDNTFFPENTTTVDKYMPSRYIGCSGVSIIKNNNSENVFNFAKKNFIPEGSSGMARKPLKSK